MNIKKSATILAAEVLSEKNICPDDLGDDIAIALAAFIVEPGAESAEGLIAALKERFSVEPSDGPADEIVDDEGKIFLVNGMRIFAESMEKAKDTFVKNNMKPGESKLLEVFDKNGRKQLFRVTLPS